MTLSFRALLAAAVFWLAGLNAAHAEEAYAFTDTEVIAYTAPSTNYAYKFYVSLPHDYAKRTNERFAVIVLLDADFSFALTRNLLRMWTDRHQSRDAIIVGIAYPGAADDVDIYHRTRTRDYTPSFTLENGYGPEIQKLSGGGPAFLTLLADGILPEIDKRYRTKTDDRMVVGISFSGLFASYALLTRPELFHRYLIVSPSLWYDHRMIFALAQQYIAKHKSLPAQVFWSVGGEENLPPPHGSPMVDYLLEFSALLKNADLKGYEGTVIVFENENHHTVFPAALSRGLRILNGFEGD